MPAFWSDGNGNPATPPANLIANPNPKPGTVNQYTVDSNFSDCSDFTQPGVEPIVSYLENLPYAAEPNCEPNHYYMLNNTNPGYPAERRAGPAVQDALPPSTGPDDRRRAERQEHHLGLFRRRLQRRRGALERSGCWPTRPIPNLTAAAVADPAHALGVAYCQICNPFQYATSIMGDPAQRAAHIKDTADLITGIQNNTLPAVSFGKPDGLLDGHPQSSKVDLFEAYVQNVLDALDANPQLKAETAVFITWDEAGGYWDSGFVQSIDFFGDGPRIPLLVLSPYSTGGKVNHNYADHVSLAEVHRAQLEPAAADRPQPRQPAQPEGHGRAIRMCRPTCRRSTICSTRSTSTTRSTSRTPSDLSASCVMRNIAF